MNEKRNVRLLLGNEACAEGAIAAGVRFFAGYPITPATEITEYMASRLPRISGCFIQMEDEIASITAATAASLGGVKAMTASSGPGLSLMQEGIGAAIIMETPLLIVNVQRGGPGIGNIQPSQGDIMQARWGTHGGVNVIALAPSSVEECFHLTVKAVGLAERFRIPVFILSDASIGHMREKITIPDSVDVVERVRPTGPPEDYKTFETKTPDGVPQMADVGTEYISHLTTFVHNEKGFPAWTNLGVTDALLRRLNNKILMHLDEIIQFETYHVDNAKVVVLAYGSTARAAKAAVQMARERGLRAGLLKLMTVWPFPYDIVRELAGHVDCMIVPELNLGQLYGEADRAMKGSCEMRAINRVDGALITPQEILKTISEVL